MSQFEYLRHVSIGQYLPLDSRVHRLDPRAKIAGYALLLLVITLTANLNGLLLAFLPILTLILLSQLPVRPILRGLIAPLPFILILAILQLFISPHAETSISLISFLGISIYFEGLLAAVCLIVRFMLLITLLTTATGTLSTLEMIYGLDLLLKPLRWLRMRTDSLVMTVQVMLRFIPMLALSAEKIAKSQASRGAEWDKRGGSILSRARRVFPLILPLFSGSLRQAETLVDAMLARSFGSSYDHTSLRSYALTPTDAVFMILTILCATAILFSPL